MAVETELKLRIAPEHLDALGRHSLLKKLAISPAKTQKLLSIYFDTPALDLKKNAMALRLRRDGSQWLQTLKGGGRVEAGLHRRNEYEVLAYGDMAYGDMARGNAARRKNPRAAARVKPPGDAEYLAMLDIAALKKIGGRLPRGVTQENLRPVFVTEFSRALHTIGFEGAKIELCLDSGAVRAGKKVHTISEIELELKSGQPLKLFRLALKLLEIAPLEAEPVSKAEYGYRMLQQAKPEALRAQPLRLTRKTELATALQVMVGSCLAHLEANVPGAIHREGEEYLHQVRVALRRMRVALNMSASICEEDAELAALRREVAGLCIKLGRSREWDVFITETLVSAALSSPDKAGLQKLLRASEKARDTHHEEVRKALGSGEFQRLMLRLGAWMNDDAWKAHVAGLALTLPRFAAQTLQRRNKNVNRLGRDAVATGDAAELHELRIACKKLRYSAELFAGLHGQDRTADFFAALSRLQNTLGEINDIAVAHRLLAELNGRARHAGALIVKEHIEQSHAKRMAELARAWKRFYRLKAYWRPGK